MCGRALNNNGRKARELEAPLFAAFEANFWESNPGPVKTVLKLMANAATQTLRLPLVPPTAALHRFAPGTACRMNSGPPEGIAPIAGYRRKVLLELPASKVD